MASALYRAIYRLRDDGDWDLIAVFGLDTSEENTESQLVTACAGVYGAQYAQGAEGESFRCIEFEKLEDVTDVYEGEDSQTKESQPPPPDVTERVLLNTIVHGLKVSGLSLRVQDGCAPQGDETLAVRTQADEVFWIHISQLDEEQAADHLAEWNDSLDL